MTIGDLIRRGSRTLSRAGIREAELDARLLLEQAARINRSDCYVHRDREVDADALHAYLVMLERRAAREPLQHILGTASFMGLEFVADGRTLIPRQDTETLAEAALEAAEEGQTVLDLCTGSGCIAVSLAYYGRFGSVTGADLSEAALEAAAENAARNGVSIEWLQSDMFGALAGRRFDLIVSNPPYIRRSELPRLMPEVRDYDPVMALDGGEDGLDFYRVLAEQAGTYLNPGGRLMMEIGYDQGEAVTALCEAKGFREVRVLKDLCGCDRVVTAVNGEKNV